MQRVKRPTAVAVLPAPPSGGTPGFFASPNPQGGVPATIPGYEWYNGIQEELMAVIESQGLAGSSADNTLLRQAITKMIQAGQRSVIIGGVAFAPAVTGTGKAVYWDSANSRFDLALADGTAKQNCVGFADVANGNVYAFGDAVLFTGLTPGARYYLDGTTAGAITATAPANVVFVGIARAATEMFVDIDPVLNFAAKGVNSDITALNAVVSGSVFRKNVVINGAFSIWQLGATVGVSASSSYAYTADQWAMVTGANQACTVSQVTGLGKSRYAGRFQRNAGQTGTGNLIVEQPFALDDFAHLRGGASKLSFRAKGGANFSPASGNVSVYLLTGTGTEGRRGGTPYTGEVTLLNGSAQFTGVDTLFTFDIPTLAANTAQAALQLVWTPTGTAGAADYFDLGEVQWEPGTVATEFERLKKTDVLRLCQVFLEKSYDLATAPGSATTVAGEQFIQRVSSTTTDNFCVRLNARKRVAPAVTLYSTVTGSAGYIRNVSAASDVAASVGTAGESAFDITWGATVGVPYAFQYLADARL